MMLMGTLVRVGTMNGFELFKQGRLREAIAAYDDELSIKPSPSTLANRALAFLSLGQYAAAARDARAADEMQLQETGERGDGYLRQLGVALWLSEDRTAACDLLHTVITGLETGSFQFTDRAGGMGSALLLWYMAVRMRNDELRTRCLAFIQTKSNAGVSKYWPGPIGEHILGRLSYVALMAAAQQQPTLSMRRGCQAVFYAGILALNTGDVGLARRLLKMAVEYGEEVPVEPEYYLALYEVVQHHQASV